MTTHEADLTAIHTARSAEGRTVGMPVQEALLTAKLVRGAREVFPPGAGYTGWILLEPATGSGIPDALIVRASANALIAHMQHGLRISNFAAARALAASDETRSGLSEAHTRALRRRLADEGWTRAFRARASEVVNDSLAIEVKLEDARQAMRQASRFQVSAHRSAILMPDRTAHRASETTLHGLGIGLLTHGDSGLQWKIHPARQTPSIARRLWLTELLLRAIESESAHTLSASRNLAKASLIARTRLE